VTRASRAKRPGRTALPEAGLRACRVAARSLAVLLALVAGACGPVGDDAEPSATETPDAASEAAPAPVPPSSPTPTPAEPAALPPVTVNTGGPAPADTIVLRARGPELAFYPDRVSARSGSVVLLRFENGGELPHNFVLVRDDGVIDALAVAAYEAASSDYVPPDLRDELIAFTPLVSPGGHADLTVTIPPPGEYTYVCLFPGHAQMMLGTLRAVP
jgi:uncharacterized cupredoxin-like copper-binding protein